MLGRGSSGQTSSPPARLLHRLAVVAVCLVWPLIWVGGLVTTYDAGMSVPDWPGTYGYNLFLYPLGTWMFGPFDLFIEHGHRLLGALVGFVAILIVIAAYRREPRRWVRLLTVALLVAVISQGLLGGLRVVLSDRTLAMVHGCVGPAFFALCVATAVITSRTWWSMGSEEGSPKVGLSRLVFATVGAMLILSYLQIILGAKVRHVQPTAEPGQFTTTVAQHVSVAVFLWILGSFAYLRLRRCGDLTLSRPGVALLGLVSLQIGLGVFTWVANYGWPGILGLRMIQAIPGAAGYLIQAKGFWDSIIVTSHVAIGSLILAFSTLLFLRVARVRVCCKAANSLPVTAVSTAALGH